MCALTSACTGGMVKDAATGNFVGGAQVNFQAVVMPSSPPAQSDLPPVSLGAVFGARTWALSDPGSNGVEGIFYLNPYAPAGTTDPMTRAVSAGWNAVTVSRSGYDTRRFYRNHLYAPCQKWSSNPISGGAYPVDTAGQGVDGGLCARQDFTLHATGTAYEKRPDLIVDPRSLLNHYVQRLASGTIVSLLFACANVGDGDLFVVAPYRAPSFPDQTLYSPATQLITRSDGSYTRVALDGLVTYTDRPEVGQFYEPSRERWAEVRLRRMDPAVCPSEDLASACPIVEDDNFRMIPPCLQDALTFDSFYRPGNNFSICSLEPIDDGGRPSLAQGVSAGRAFRDSGSAILGQLPPGPYWLEVEVNVGRTIVESDYTNNIARRLIQL